MQKTTRKTTVAPIFNLDAYYMRWGPSSRPLFVPGSRSGAPWPSLTHFLPLIPPTAPPGFLLKTYITWVEGNNWSKIWPVNTAWSWRNPHPNQSCQRASRPGKTPWNCPISTQWPPSAPGLGNRVYGFFSTLADHLRLWDTLLLWLLYIGGT